MASRVHETGRMKESSTKDTGRHLMVQGPRFENVALRKLDLKQPSKSAGRKGVLAHDVGSSDARMPPTPRKSHGHEPTDAHRPEASAPNSRAQE